MSDELIEFMFDFFDLTDEEELLHFYVIYFSAVTEGKGGRDCRLDRRDCEDGGGGSGRRLLGDGGSGG